MLLIQCAKLKKKQKLKKMSSSDSDDERVTQVFEAKRAGHKIRHDARCNPCFFTEEMVRGRIEQEDGTKRITAHPTRVGEIVMKKRKEIEAGPSSSTSTELTVAFPVQSTSREMVVRSEDGPVMRDDVHDLTSHVAKRAALGAHSIGAWIVRTRKDASAKIAQASVELRMEADNGITMPGVVADTLSSSPSLTKMELKRRIEAGEDLLAAKQRELGQQERFQKVFDFADSQLRVIGTNASTIRALYNTDIQVCYVKSLTHMIESTDTWDRRFNGDGARVTDGCLLPNSLVPNFGTPITQPYTNAHLKPYSGKDPFTLPCRKGATCVRRGTYTAGSSVAASRVEQTQPYCALVPPDVEAEWITKGKEPEREWDCFFCTLEATAHGVMSFERMNLTPPFPLHRIAFARDETGRTGFPSQMMYEQVTATGRGTGIHDGFLRLSSVLTVPLPGGASAIVIPDFRSPSATNGTV